MPDAEQLSASAIITALDLSPHPEGGYYRETFRDGQLVGGRPVSTAIYFLLPEGVTSRWHRIDAVETWHWYRGAALDLRIAETELSAQSLRLGPHIEAGERPQGIVPHGHWQQARSLGAWTLCGCTVAPGFTFDGFRMAPPGFDPPLA